MALRKSLIRHIYETSSNEESRNTFNVILNQIVSEEASKLLEVLRSRHGKATNVFKLMRQTVWRIMWRFVFGQECSMKEAEINKIQESIVASNRDNNLFQMRQLIPFWCTRILMHLPILNSLVCHNGFESHREARRVLDSHVDKALDDASIKTSIAKNLYADPKTNLSRDEFRRLMYEVMAAGTDTTSLTLIWACDYLARCHENGLVQLGPEHLDLIHRWASVVPLSLPHIARQEFQVRSYAIPKDAIVIYNSYGVHHEQLKQILNLGSMNKSTVHQKPIPFSLGLRACPGNRIAEEILLQILTAIHNDFVIQAIKSEPNEEIDSVNYMSLMPIGLTRVPIQCTFMFNSRRAMDPRQTAVG